MARHALEDHRRRAVRERPVHDVTVARDPADVRRAPVHVVLAQVEHRLVRERGVDEIAAARVQHALRLAGGARRVKDEQRVFRVDRDRLAFVGLRVDDFVVPLVAVIHRDRRPGALHDQHVLDRLGARRRQRLVHVGLERHLLAAAHAFVRRDHDGRRAVRDAPGERIGREAAEDHGMDRTDPRAREHGDGGFGNHRQVDGDAVALLHAQALQRIRELADAVIELAVRDVLRDLGVVAFVDERRLVAARGEMPVEAVVRDVELAVVVPADVEVVRVETDVLHPGVRLHPVDALAHAGPEALRVADRFGVGLLVVVLAEAGPGRERRRHFVQLLVHRQTPLRPDCCRDAFTVIRARPARVRRAPRVPCDLPCRARGSAGRALRGAAGHGNGCGRRTGRPRCRSTARSGCRARRTPS